MRNPAKPDRNDRRKSTVATVLPCDSWQVKSPSVYATPEVHALVGTGLSKTLCWYATRLSAGMFRRISHQVQPVRMSASTSTTENTAPKETEPTTSTLKSALSSMRLSSTKRRSLACRFDTSVVKGACRRKRGRGFFWSERRTREGS